MHRLERKKLGVLPIAATIFFVVSGGPYTAEQVVGKSGPLAGLLILTLLPLVWCFPVGMMTAELSARFPEEGGYFVWVKNGLGPFPGFLCAWWSWASSWVDLALYPLIAVQYAAHLGVRISHPYAWILLIIAVITCWNLLGVKSIGRLSLLLFILILIPFVILMGFGLREWLIRPPLPLPLLNGPPKWDGIGAAMVLGLWNYFGWDSLSTASGEIEGAEKTFPKAIGLGILMVTAMIVLPVLAGIAIKTNWPDWDNDNGYWPEIAAAAWNPLKWVIVLGGVLSNVGLFAANLLASSRIPYVLSEDRYLPKFISQGHSRFGTPWVALLIGAVLSAIFAREGFDKLVAIDLSLYLFALILELAALVVLRRSDLGESRFRIGGGKIGLALCVGSPVVVAALALFLQLNPRTGMSDLAINPVLLLAILALTGPVWYGVNRTWIARAKK